MNVTFDVEDEAWSDVPGLEAGLRRAAALALGDDARSVAIVLSDNDNVRALNRDWRGKDSPTNVLSFPQASAMPLPPGEPAPLGDVILAFETVAAEAEAQGKTLSAHASHLVIHGILHLLGYDHGTDAEAEAMEARERGLLAQLGVADPYET